jgi:hypothetical protein
VVPNEHLAKPASVSRGEYGTAPARLRAAVVSAASAGDANSRAVARRLQDAASTRGR